MSEIEDTTARKQQDDAEQGDHAMTGIPQAARAAYEAWQCARGVPPGDEPDTYHWGWLSVDAQRSWEIAVVAAAPHIAAAERQSIAAELRRRADGLDATIAAVPIDFPFTSEYRIVATTLRNTAWTIEHPNQEALNLTEPIGAGAETGEQSHVNLDVTHAVGEEDDQPLCFTTDAHYDANGGAPVTISHNPDRVTCVGCQTLQRPTRPSPSAPAPSARQKAQLGE